LIATGVFAQDETAAAPLVPETDPIIAAEQALSLDNGASGLVQPVPAASAWGIFRVVLTLAVIAVAIYGLVFFIKRFSRGSTAQDPFLKVLAYTPLGNNRGAYILSVGSKAWLVGAAESGVRLISEIEEKEVLDAMLLEDSRRIAEAPAQPFPDFKSLLHRLGVSPDSAATAGPESIRKRSERLKGL
jgi:flagellar protein FliO/FliZ